jgi:hypothetical protein
LVIGGLFTDSITKSLESIPFIEKIPIIGELFKDRQSNKSKSELIFVLQPSVLGLKGYDKFDIASAPALEDDINQTQFNLPQTEKMLVDSGAKKAKAKPVRISASEVTPRSVSIIEKVPSDFPPIKAENLAPSDAAPVTKSASSVMSIRPEEETPEVKPSIELAPEVPQPQ